MAGYYAGACVHTVEAAVTVTPQLHSIRDFEIFCVSYRLANRLFERELADVHLDRAELLHYVLV